MLDKFSPCGAANLLSVVFGEGKNKVKAKLGLPYSDKHICPKCGGPKYKLSHQCFKCRRLGVVVICSYCGSEISRQVSEVLEYDSRINNPKRKGKGRVGYFCNKVCHGKWFAENYGFKVYPEHSGRRKKCVLDTGKKSQK